MPANNRKSAKNLTADRIKVGSTPEKMSAPHLIFRKTMQDALIDGLSSVSTWARDFLDVDPYEAQCTFLDTTRDASEANFVAGNRVGKSWSGGIILSWRAFYRFVSPYTAPERPTPHNVYKAVAVSMTIDQAKLSWNYALTFMTTSKRFKPFLREYLYSPFPTIYLQTKNERGDWVPSEVWARSLAKNGLYLLGHSINFILIDECAYIKNYPMIEDEVIRMRLADTGGSIFRISTPNGRNHFYNYFQDGLAGLKQHDPSSGMRPRYYSQRVATWDNPAVSRAYLEEAQRRMIPEYYAQNILGEFISLSDFFKIDQIQNCYDSVEVELNDGPKAGREYVLGVDLGALRDPTVCYVLDVTGKDTPLLVGLYEVKNGSWASARALANQVYHQWKPIYSTIDATGVGRPISQQLIEEDGWANTEEFIFTAQSKPDLMTRLQDQIQRTGIRFPYVTKTQELIQQLSFYKLDDKTITQDHVIALALANWSYEKAKKVNFLDTTIYDDLAIIPVYSGGASVPDDMGMGPGLRFSLDEETGMFYPEGGDGMGFLI